MKNLSERWQRHDEEGGPLAAQKSAAAARRPARALAAVLALLAFSRCAIPTMELVRAACWFLGRENREKKSGEKKKKMV